MMKRTTLRLVTEWALFLGLMASATVGASAQDSLPVFGEERLAAPQNWTESDASFTPSSPGHDATIDFPASKWSALIGTLPVKGLVGSFSLHLRCRWAGDVTTIQGTSCVLMFEDADGKEMPGTVDKPLQIAPGWQDVIVKARAPSGAVTLRFDISSRGGGRLEVENYALSLVDVDLSTAAVTGVTLPWLSVPGGKETAPDGAQVAFVTQAPYSFDDPVWTKLPTYPIPTTTTNKTPLTTVAAGFQMAWTPENLFVRYHARDALLTFKARSRYERDCFEFFLMPTGHVGKANAQVSKEQYTITRTADGQTDANVDALTRLVSDGWEAIVKIPLQTETRRIYPFNGLALTFNAVYQDSDTLPQEHWLSFSKRDQTNSSWQDPSLYVPLVFQTDAAMPYKPLWLGGGDTAYNVDPKFPGRINLVHSSASMANVDLWDKTPEARLTAYAEGGHDCFRVQYPPTPRQRRVIFVLSPFNVLAGETLDVTMDGRTDAGPAVAAPGVAFLSESSWNLTGTSRAPTAPLSPQWGKLSYTMTMPESARGSLRNGRIMLTIGVQPGRRVEIRDVKVTRRLPADFDALISVPSHYSHFWSGEPNVVKFQFASLVATPAKITAKVQSYFTGKTLLSHEWTRTVPAGQTSSNWDVSALPNGFFNVLLKVRDANGGFLADRELYVTKSVRNTRLSPFSGIFVNNSYDVIAPASIPQTVAMLKGMGEGRAQWADFYLFDSAGNDLPGDPLALLRAFHKAGIETGYTVPQSGTHYIGRNWQPEELQPFYDRFLTRTKGLFDHLSFSNEPNLYGGWFPEPDAREWAIYNRGFYNSVKRDTPETRAILGSFNDIPLDYVKTAASENKNSFADGVIGMHLYGLEVNGGGFQDLLDSRRVLDQIHPGWEAWDTESGIVFYTFEAALDLQSKKMPILLNAGYTSSIYLDGAGFTFPCGDSTPLIPMEAFKNNFYLDSTPVGHTTLADGRVHVYLFRRTNGQGIAAFWNTSHDALTVSLPIHGTARLLDLFGNSLGDLGGSTSIALNDRFVRYAESVDLGSLTKSPAFIAAFKKTRSQPASDPGYTKHVFLSLPAATKAFDREITPGQTSSLAISLHNAGAVSEMLNLACTVPVGLQVTFGSSTGILLKPQETRIVSVQMKAGRPIEKQTVRVTGTLKDGLKVLPLIFSVQTIPPIDVSGYTRAVEIANHSSVRAEVSVVATKPEFVFRPGVIKETLGPDQSEVMPLQATPNGSYHGNFNSLNVPVYYTMSVTSPQGTRSKDGRCLIFSPGLDDGGPPDFTNLPYTANPERPGSEPFQVDYKLTWVPKGLRIIARVLDSSPSQNGENGYLRDGGDCMVLAFDPSDAQTPGVFGANYFECGFAYSHHAPTSYLWNGHYGLESATPFPEAINKINRDANYVTYDVTIPEKRLFPQIGAETAGMSIAFVNKGQTGPSQIIELGQGIFPQRAPAKMGILLKRK